MSLPNRIASLTLSAAETAVRFSAKWTAFAVRNDGESDVYIAAKSGETAGNADTLLVAAGGSAVFYHGVSLDTCYILGETGGKVTVIGQNSNVNPFKTAAKGGGCVDYAQNLSVAFELMGIDITPQTDSLSLVRECGAYIKNMMYFNYTGVIFTYSDRFVTKTYDDPCYAAWCYRGKWFAPVFIGKNANSVEHNMYYSTDYRIDGTFIDEYGELWYYTIGKNGSYQNVSPDETRLYLGRYTDDTIEQSALDLLKIVNKYEKYLEI